MVGLEVEDANGEIKKFKIKKIYININIIYKYKIIIGKSLW